MSLLNGTMTPIQTITVGSGGQATIEFTNIPQTYTDLCILLSARQSSTGGTNVNMKFNGSSINYTNKDMISAAGNAISEGTVLGTSSIKIGFIPDNTNYTTSTFSNQYIHISNYASSNSKSVSTDNAMENNSTSVYFGFFSGLWSDASAITSIALTPENGSFVQHSAATLYGISKYTGGQSGSKATGGTVTTSGGYTYHTFTTSGNFVPTTNISNAEVLIVAGGGSGGGWDIGGGGGAGGLVYASSQSFTSGTNYSAIVGAGGSRTIGANGSNGSNSSFHNLTVAVGGGRGGGSSPLNGSDGGSGGGGGEASYTYGTGGSPTSGQGNAGASANGTNNQAGGGGGAGAAGNGSAAGGAGGIGSNSYSTWATVTSTGSSGYYAGGGGGGRYGSPAGSGGLGGGGAGGTANSSGFNGTANTGGGGGGTGGGNPNNACGAGGSGVVIVRYLT